MTIGTPRGHGRTRRPKALFNDDAVLTKQTATTVAVVAAADLNNSLNDTVAGQNGYSTENQRFLHLQIENDGTDDTLTLYGYNYAFGSWAIMYLPVGVKNGADTTAELSYVAATFATINGKKILTIPIHGVDRIGFVHDGTLNDMVVRAACSTF
tara:strand:- start:1585 stop:2046 length:462 start_codon:yes stop_codon:yes gene_type:complete